MTTNFARPLPEDRLHPIWTAHHEAGHAVAYLFWGLAFESVTILSDDADDHLGMVRRAPTMTPDYMLGSITAAGPAAEIHLHGLHHPPEDPDDDDEVIRRLVVSLTLRDNLETHAELREAVSISADALTVAADLVDARWPSIAALAEALLNRETLTYEECLKIDKPH